MLSEREAGELQNRLYCLETIIAYINEGVLLTDRDCKITVFNSAKEEMEKMRAGDVMGKISWEAYPHSNPEVSEHKRVFDTRAPILNVYRPHAYVDDIPVYISYSTYPIVRGDEVLGVVTISRNETMLQELLFETVELKRQLRRAMDAPPERASLAKGTQYNFSNIVGGSPEMAAVVRDAEIVSTLDTPILLIGETGTGKEVLAQSIHNLGRPDKKYVAINCAAIPENLTESILFGSVKGAYTGAVDAVGLFAEAQDGTLFLDEVNSMTTVMQAKLLRALQERCVRPVGSSREVPIRCRLIFASNEQPQALIAQGRLRPDLYYRMSGYSLFIPPLRERRGDILELAHYFIGQCNRKFQKGVQRMADDLAGLLQATDWPGNTRELQHFVQNMMLRVPETAAVLTLGDIPAHLRGTLAARPAKEAAPGPEDYLDTRDLGETLMEVQRKVILHSLRQCDNNMTRAAQRIGIGRQNLLARMKRLQIQKPESELK